MAVRNGVVALAVGFAAGVLAIGPPYWRIPYAQLTLPDSIWGAGLVVVGVLALGVRVLGGVSSWRVGLVVGGSVPAAVLARVVVDVARDPTTHNLWPLELVLATGPGLLAGFAGALFGGLLVSRGRRR